MLERAERRVQRDGVEVTLQLGDAQALPFLDASFDTVVATFVFCSVPGPVQGSREAFRVLIPSGQLLLLEHVLSEKPLLRGLMRLANPLVVRMSGANIDRETVRSVKRAGFIVGQARDLWGDIVKLTEAERPTTASAGDRVCSADHQGRLSQDSASQDKHGSGKPRQSEGDRES
jgi:phosphatidylethanolamine/phosphatidyl-N-methylethanolamine N-methyltransferase